MMQRHHGCSGISTISYRTCAAAAAASRQFAMLVCEYGNRLQVIIMVF
jgi:hypothetical protein